MKSGLRPFKILLYIAAFCTFVAEALAQAKAPAGLSSSDLYRLRSVSEVQLSPDGQHVAYTVVWRDRPGLPYRQIWIADVATGRAARCGDEEESDGPRWSPDGKRIAYFAHGAKDTSLLVRDFASAKIVYSARVIETNHPLPSSGERIAWSPDGKQLAYVATTPGPEKDADGDPMVITRYLYKPHLGEGETRFNDNRRTHLFIADLATGHARQLTTGHYYEHSIDWSPLGGEIAFISNRGPDPDRFFNYDIFSVQVVDGAIRRITDTKSAEYYPQWSPDGRSIAFSGTTRPLTSSETTLEDTHVWVVSADGTNRREVGDKMDNRQEAPRWSADGTHLYFKVHERGSLKLARVPVASGPAKLVVADPGIVFAFSVERNALAYAQATLEGPAELFVQASGRPRQLTALNRDLLLQRSIAPVEPFTFASVDGMPTEAFLTKPVGIPAERTPLIVMIHGGPHQFDGPWFNEKAQIYAAKGWAILMVNFRGSTGYGQKITDAIFSRTRTARRRRMYSPEWTRRSNDIHGSMHRGSGSKG